MPFCSSFHSQSVISDQSSISSTSKTPPSTSWKDRWKVTLLVGFCALAVSGMLVSGLLGMHGFEFISTLHKIVHLNPFAIGGSVEMGVAWLGAIALAVFCRKDGSQQEEGPSIRSIYEKKLPYEPKRGGMVCVPFGAGDRNMLIRMAYRDGTNEYQMFIDGRDIKIKKGQSPGKAVSEERLGWTPFTAGQLEEAVQFVRDNLIEGVEVSDLLSKYVEEDSLAGADMDALCRDVDASFFLKEQVSINGISYQVQTGVILATPRETQFSSGSSLTIRRQGTLIASGGIKRPAEIVLKINYDPKKPQESSIERKIHLLD